MKSKRSQSGGWVVFGGLALTASGIAHLVRPRVFESVNRLAFKDRIRAHVVVNGTIEAALGLALINPPTRRAAVAATVAYLTYFNASVLRRQRFLRVSSPSPLRRYRRRRLTAVNYQSPS